MYVNKFPVKWEQDKMYGWYRPIIKRRYKTAGTWRKTMFGGFVVSSFENFHDTEDPSNK